MNDFVGFPKMARLHRDIMITEKIDGTNAQVVVSDDCTSIRVASRTRWITPEDDNFGFARWAVDHTAELLTLGPGRHFGEWWGKGIQRGYGLAEKRFSLFNAHRWDPATLPECINVVPVLYHGIFDMAQVSATMERLRTFGSVASPGFMEPEGIILYHLAGNVGFKKTLEGDEGKFNG